MRIVRNAAMALSLASCAAFCQSTQNTSSASQTSQSSASTAVAGHKTRAKARYEFHEPTCWQQAGLTPDMVNQRWHIQDQGKVKIAQACNEASLSPEQRHAKIDEVNVETDQAIAKLIPAKQLQTLRSCEADWSKAHPKPAGQRELGPCGGIIPSSAASEAAPAHEHH
jgi:hypothetical protein